MLVSDIVTHNLPLKMKENMNAWVGCVAGALEEEEYLNTIRDTGFKEVAVVGKIVFDEGIVKGMISGRESNNALLEETLARAKEAGYRDGMVSSIKVRAFK